MNFSFTSKMKEIDPSLTCKIKTTVGNLRVLPVDGIKLEIELKSGKSDVDETQYELNKAIYEESTAGDGEFKTYACKIESTDDYQGEQIKYSSRSTKSNRISKKQKVVHKKRRKKRKKRTHTHSSVEEFQPIVINAALETFLNKGEERLGCVKFKNIKLRREMNSEGYSLEPEELDIFSKIENGKVLYLCDDCNFSSESRDVFTVHFIMHANLYFIVETINKTSSSHYCYICDEECLSGTLLQKHLVRHKGNNVNNKDNMVLEDVCQHDNALKVESFEDINDQEKMDDDVLQDCHFFAVDDSHYSENEIEKDEMEDIKEKVLEGVIKFEPQKPQHEGGVNMDVVKYESESKDEDIPKVKEEFVVPIEEIKDETKYVKCEDCKLEAPIAELEQHKCKEVRQCTICEKKFLTRGKLRTHRDLHFCGVCSFKSVSTEAVLEHKKSNKDCLFKCTDCKFKSSSRDSFRRHLRNKMCSKRCDVCRKIFKTKDAYKHHSLKHFCHRCPFKSSSLEEVSEHIEENRSCWYKCLNCKFETGSQALLQRHKDYCFNRNKKKEKLLEPATCAICGYKTSYRENVEKHSILCNNLSKTFFICKICGRACRDSLSLQKHSHLHYCEICPFMSVSRKDILSHKSNSPDCMYKCDNCDYQTVHIRSMSFHQMKGCRNKLDGIVKTWDTNDVLSCDMCCYRTNSTFYFEAHMKKHSDPKPFHCNQCDFKCSQRGNLRTHKKKHMLDKNYCCVVCSFECSRLSMFQKHKKMHGLDTNSVQTKDRDPKYFYCDRCEFRSKHALYLKSHVLKHDNIRPYLCPHCGKTFTSSTECNTHKHIAHSENLKNKIFNCSYCDYTSRNKGTVKIHERKHTGAKPYSCEFCSYSTSYSGNLSHHRKMHLKRDSSS